MRYVLRAAATAAAAAAVAALAVPAASATAGPGPTCVAPGTCVTVAVDPRDPSVCVTVTQTAIPAVIQPVCVP